MYMIGCLYSCRNASDNSQINQCLPEIKSCSFDSILYKKVYADPSYRIPYNIYMRLNIDDSLKRKIISLLLLKSKKENDNSLLRSLTTSTEYNNYFKINSINAIRYDNLAKESQQIKWWTVDTIWNKEQDIYAASYFDDGNIKKAGCGNDRKNGRIVCCFKDRYCFILIECWG